MLCIFMMIENDEERNKAEEIYEKYGKKLFLISYRILGNREDAEDAVMDAFCRIVKNIRKFFDLPCNEMESLLVIYIRNTSFDLYRKRKERPVDSFCEWIELPEEGLSMEERVVAKDSFQNLIRMISDLPEIYSSVFLLRYHFGYKAKEIAEALSIEESSVRSRLLRAKQMLRKGGLRND